MNWFGFKEVYDKIYNELPDGSAFVEIGALFGDSTCYFANKIKNGNKKIKFITIDLLEQTAKSELYMNQNVWNNKTSIYNEFLQRIKQDELTEYIDIWKGDSSTLAEGFKDESIDCIMFDGDHTYEGLKKDIVAYLPKIKKGGLLYGDDYGHLGFLGVKKAVDEFFEVTLFPILLKGVSYNVWRAVK